ncbi:MAG: hypothetical protein ACI8RE_003530, partial [Ilumatobacter sp.]
MPVPPPVTTAIFPAKLFTISKVVRTTVSSEGGGIACEAHYKIAENNANGQRATGNGQRATGKDA